MTKSEEVNFVHDAFNKTDLKGALISWIDVLGVSHMTSERLRDLFTFLPDLGNIVSSQTHKNLKPKDVVANASVNTLIIGDAICITQKDDSLISKYNVATISLFISLNLFDKGFPNRGIVTFGDYQTGKSATSTPYVVGPGVIKAFNQEKKINVCGIVLDPDLYDDLKSWQFVDDSGSNFLLSEKFGCFRFLTDRKNHLNSWKKFVDLHYHDHPYITASRPITDEIFNSAV